VSANQYPTAVVMNMFYTGLGIARSLGSQGIPVIGLSSHKKCYGNFTRFAKTVFAPDSRHQPEALLAVLVDLGRKLGKRSVIFPTRDDDVVFLDRYRQQLEPYYSITVPQADVLSACLNKWETSLWARSTGVPSPKTWIAANDEDIRKISSEVSYPAVLKPVAAYQWRQGGNWEIVQGRKAIGVSSREQLLAEYSTIAAVGENVLIQEMIPGDDNCLLIVACYVDQNSKLVASFNTQKLLQIPRGFGTGCIVQSTSCPELLEPTRKLLEGMRFTGIAEVEYKWNSVRQEYQLIEINPRPWDQHILGTACGVDLASFAYFEHAGLPMPIAQRNSIQWKWVAEDAFVMAALGSIFKGTSEIRTLFRLARGRRIFALWAGNDPKPFFAWVFFSLLPTLGGTGLHILGKFGQRVTIASSAKKEAIYEGHFQKGKNHT
jgi:D-aspartate ligase